MDKISKKIIQTDNRFIKEREYWLKNLQDTVGMSGFKYDYNCSKPENYQIDIINENMPEDIFQKILKISSNSYHIAYIILLEGVKIVLKKYTENSDLIVGMPVFNQNEEKKYINNVLAIRSSMEDKKSVKQLLIELKDIISEANKHRNYPFENIAEELGLIDDNNKTLFNTIVILENIHTKQAVKNANPDIMFVFHIKDNTLKLRVEYKSELFEMATIKRIIKHLIGVYGLMLNNLDIRLSDIEMITEEEKHQIHYRFNNTYAEYPRDKTIHELFEEQAVKVPDNIAVVYEEKELTYRELNNKANQLAKALIEKGMKPGDIVGIILESSIEMIAGIVGILKAGGAYLPIDPKYPGKRIEYMINDCKADILVTSSKLAGIVEFKGNTIFVDDEDIWIGNADNPSIVKKPDDLAYVMYTSGTTGKPKGILTTHSNVIRVVKNTNYINIDSSDVVLQTSNYAFDGSTFNIYAALLNGSKLVLLENVLEINKLISTIKNENVTVFFLTTQLFNALVDMDINNLKGVRKILFGGENASVAHVKKAVDCLGTDKLIHVYGPTESTVFATYYHIESVDANQKNIPIGVPLANTEVYILNKSQKLQPFGLEGEIYISGEGLAKGYLNLDELTRDKFVENPFKKGALMYKTGDIGKINAEGNIEFVGRADQQVKVRGHRIEISEIEDQLIKYPGIDETLILVKEHEDSNRYLTAYVLSSEELVISDIINYLSVELPDYMIPAYFVQLNQWPLTPNGKIDRRALPEPDTSIRVEYAAPRNETEEKLAAVYKEVLGADKVGINDNFFDLGGHSLKAIILISQIHKQFNIEVPLKEIFRLPVLKDLAGYIEKNENVTMYQPIRNVKKQEYYELSSAQKRLYILNQIEGESITYNIPYTMIIEGKLDVEALEKAFSKIIKRHEALRTSFEAVNGQTVQKIHDDVDFKINIIHMQGSDKEEDIRKEFIKPFDLSKAPLFRVYVIKRNENEHILFIDMHHIISDGTSLDILLKELGEFYEGRELDKIPIQYKDYSEWQNELFKDEKFKKQEKYWVEKFKGEIPALSMPLDYQRPVQQSFEGETIEFQIDNDLASKLKQLARETETTLYMVLLAAYTALLYKYTGQEDIIAGTPIAGRSHADLQNIIGMFVNTLAIRNYPKGELLFTSYLEEVKRSVLESFENGDYPFEELVDKLAIKRDISRNPLFDTMFALENMDLSELEIKGLSIKPCDEVFDISKFDITLTAAEAVNGINFYLEYCTKLFKEETIRRMSEHFINLLKAIVNNPLQRLCDIDILSEKERNILLYEFSNTGIENSRDGLIHELFEEQVKRTPDNIAAITKEQKLTYNQINQLSNKLARALIENKVSMGQKVAVLLDKSPMMIASILGIFKAGSVFVPIDINYPPKRIEKIISESNSKIIISEKKYLENVEFCAELLDCAALSLDGYSGENLNLKLNKDDLAYIIFTSGTTGIPKGIMAEHRNVISYVNSFNRLFNMNSKDTTLQQASITFDGFVEEIFTILLAGGAVVLPEDDHVKDIKYLWNLIDKYKVTILSCSPLILSQFNKLPRLDSVHTFLSSSDVLKGQYYTNLVKHSNVYNMYGPTETTVCATYYKCSEDSLTNVPIGIPMKNYSIYILDKELNVQSIGVYGEIYIGGSGVSRGYLNNNELTDKKFIRNPYNRNEIIYRTGDMGRWLSDRNIELLQRIDQQVKIRGYRIETGEIEAALVKHEFIEESVVVCREDEEGNKYLVAYYTAIKDLNVNEIRQYLLKELPNYMVPSYFVQLEKMPLTHNGKINKRELPEIKGNINTGAEYVAPRNEIEEQLAKMYEKTLGISRVGIEDNFFDLGGHSLKATILRASIHEQFNIEVPLREIFRLPIVKDLADYIEKETAKKIEMETKLEIAMSKIDMIRKRHNKN